MPVPAAGPIQDPDSLRNGPGAAVGRPKLKLLLVAANYHLATPDLRNLVAFLHGEECASPISLEIADPPTIRNCWNCTGWWRPRPW